MTNSPNIEKSCRGKLVIFSNILKANFSLIWQRGKFFETS